MRADLDKLNACRFSWAECVEI